MSTTGFGEFANSFFGKLARHSKKNMARLLMRLGVAAAITAFSTQLSPAFAETRVALVIGNEAYQNVPPLRNPANDANAVAAALKRSGFDTITAINLDQRGMEDAAIRFSRAARTADIALFYYSGHALQFNGVNYLAPVDTILKDEADLRRLTRVDQIVEDLQQAKNLRILVLDSCRDNPFAEQLRRAIGTTRAVAISDGLAKIDAPQGMIMAYATQAGRTAADGKGDNSPYTAAFLKHIEKQEEIGTIFREISEDVYETTNHRQLPELSLSVIGRFYLRGNGSGDASPSVSSAPPSAVNGSRSDYEAALAVDTEAGWDAFLRQHAEGLYADLARERKAKIEKGKQAAYSEIRAAAERGDANAQFNLGLMYEEGRGVAQDYAQAVAWYRKAADQGNANGQAGLGAMYANGWGIERDDTEAVAWFRKAVEQGNAPRGQAGLGMMYADRRGGVERDDVQAVSWYRKAADQGYARAQCNLGVMYEKGRGVERDDARAVSWYRKAADQGYAEAQDNLGWMYDNGKGVERDDAQAVSWYRKAAEQGNAGAQYHLGLMYGGGRGVPKDPVQAVSLYRKAAERGLVNAQSYLGLKYGNGWDVKQDYAESVMWLRKAAEQGDAQSQYNLALSYENGWGVARDDAQAVSWYRKAADQGSTIGQYNLGAMYENGRGVPKDRVQAISWYRKAADHGNAQAREALRRMQAEAEEALRRLEAGGTGNSKQGR